MAWGALLQHGAMQCLRNRRAIKQNSNSYIVSKRERVGGTLPLKHFASLCTFQSTVSLPCELNGMGMICRARLRKKT